LSGEAPDVSVVIPVGGVDAELELQLDALAQQTYRDRWQLILSVNTPDAEARGRAEQVLERWQAEAAAVASSAQAVSAPSVSVVDSSSVRSASHARNVGAQAARGRMLAFCDADDIADVDWLARMVDALAEGRAVGGHLDEELLAVVGQEDWRPPATPGALPTFLGHPYLVTANMGLYRSDFEGVGGFDVSLTRGEDIAFSWDLIERGVELTYNPHAVIYYRHRRGLWPMMRQHYLYGRGFSEILARRGVPGQDGSRGLSSLKPNGQPVDRKNLVYFARRGSIATGRVVGLLDEYVAGRRSPSR
jgi:glycosyltransferase involved in cell wall biosynthesis